MCPLDYWPVGVPVYDDEVMYAHVLKEVSTDALEGVHWLRWRVWWCAWLGGCHSVAMAAMAAVGSKGCDGRGYAWPEDVQALRLPLGVRSAIR